jgi:hypothetical protein
MIVTLTLTRIPLDTDLEYKKTISIMDYAQKLDYSTFIADGTTAEPLGTWPASYLFCGKGASFEQLKESAYVMRLLYFR